MDVKKALLHKERTRRLSDMEGCENITNEELLQIDCDVLIPAAIENQISVC
jgi:glutamate dehydrogenase (NAD(P)+)